jgi:23S rRNA pseudouridine1911/1915/1917 synthase
MTGPSYETLHVTAAHEGAVVTNALRALLPGRSWSQIKRLLSQRRVQINGNLCVDEGRRVKQGDVIRVNRLPVAAPITAADVRLVHIDEHVVVIDKPAGVTTLRHNEERDWSHQRKQRQATLDELIEELLSGQGREQRSVKPPTSRRRPQSRPNRIRAVHRLDRDTSGIMVFARTPLAETELIRQFKSHTVDRAYIAFAHGHVAEETIETYFVRDRGDGLRGSTPDPKAEGAERALTHIRPLEVLRDYTVVECRLETGRTHQIRIHLAERGHMVCGEKTYVRTLAGPVVEDASGAVRQALHAAMLGFTHPVTGVRLQFVSPLPKDMAKLLERLRRTSA